MKTAYKHITEITPFINPPWTTEAEAKTIYANFLSYGYLPPLFLDEYGIILLGHAQYKTAILYTFTFLPVIEIHGLTEKTKRLLRYSDI